MTETDTGDFMLSYDEIIKRVILRFGIVIHHTCWIAEVKRFHSLTRGKAWNSGKGLGAPPCPPDVFRAIEQVLRESGDLKQNRL